MTVSGSTRRGWHLPSLGSHRRFRRSLISPKVFFFQAEDGIRDYKVTGVQTCALPISLGITVGTVTPTMKAFRPGAGRVWSAVESSTVPCDALAVSVSGDSPLTVTFSDRKSVV